MIILGIDPGLEGALSYIDGERAILVCSSLPFYEKTSSTKKTKKFIDQYELASILKKNKLPDYAYIEQVASSPQMGVVSSFSFGEGYGKVQGVLAGLGVPLTFVPPQVWKKTLNVPKDKKEAIARANQLFPNAAFKKDGQAEASLIALYGTLSLGIKIKERIERVEGF